MEARYFITSGYNKFTSEILNTKIKENKLIDKSDNSIFVESSRLNKKLATLATNVELTTEQDKIARVQAFDSSYL